MTAGLLMLPQVAWYLPAQPWLSSKGWPRWPIQLVLVGTAVVRGVLLGPLVLICHTLFSWLQTLT